jgi:NitT/TauT family transport system substrate-binding protein
MKQSSLAINVDRLSRRDFLKVAGGLGLSAAGTVLLEACGVKPAAPTTEADTLETTTIRLVKAPSLCLAPLYVAEDFLKGEAFTEVQYVDIPTGNVVEILSTGQADLGMQFSGPIVTYLDAGKPLTVLAGVHVGCFVLFGNKQINTINDLKGKTVSILALGSPEHIFLSSMLAFVGLDPNTDITWVTAPRDQAQQQFTNGKLDAFLAFPPVAQELMAKKIGHVVVNSMMDKPWSQYFCCMATFNQDFVQTNPVATKRALRALLKAADVCAREPEQVAQFMVDKGYTQNYDYALETMQQIPYNVWREYDPEDTLRFYALRLHDVGMIKGNPEQIIAKGTDWTFLNELKTELKG